MEDGNLLWLLKGSFLVNQADSWGREQVDLFWKITLTVFMQENEHLMGGANCY